MTLQKKRPARKKPLAGPVSLTPRDVAARHAISVDRVLLWIREGKLSAINIGDGLIKPRWRILPSALDAFERARTTPTPTTPIRRRRTDPSITQFF